MYVIVVHTVEGPIEYFGPFPTEKRANAYAESFGDDKLDFKVRPIIVPNCVTVVLNY